MGANESGSPVTMRSNKTDTVFLIGAGRSGTTLLYKLLALHPRVAYVSNYDARLPLWVPTGYLCRAISGRYSIKRFAWFDDDGGAYTLGRPLWKKVVPTPAEGESVYQRCGIPWMPPPGLRVSSASIEKLRGAFGAIQRRQGGALVLSKRTANNRRIPTLVEAFPDARFVCLERDGRAVAYSLTKVDWWLDHVVWWDGRTVREMVASGEDEISIAARNWLYESQEIERGLRAVPSANLLTVRYEELMRAPVMGLGEILRFLGLDVPPDYVAAVQELELRVPREKWASEWTNQNKNLVSGIIGERLIRSKY